MNIFSLKTRKRLFIVAAVLSVLSCFLPIYTIHGYGVVLSIMNEFSEPVTLMPTLFGVVILISAILVAVFSTFRIKVGYIIASLVNVAVSASGIIDLSIRASIDPEKLFEQVGTPMLYHEVSGVNSSIGYFAVVISILFMLGSLLINFLSRDDEEE